MQLTMEGKAEKYNVHVVDRPSQFDMVLVLVDGSLLGPKCKWLNVRLKANKANLKTAFASQIKGILSTTEEKDDAVELER